MIDSTFRYINRISVLSFKNDENDLGRDSLGKYYMPFLEIKYFNVLIANRLFFDQSAKNKQETYENSVEISSNDDYTAGILLDYLYHQNYKLIAIDFSRQTNTTIP